jgi:hypothetical protein
MRRAAAGFDFFENCVTADISRDDVFAVLGHAIVLRELLHAIVQQSPAKLIAERVPHDWIHTDQSRRQMADGEELHEFHIHERCTRAQSQGIAVAAHVR